MLKIMSEFMKTFSSLKTQKYRSMLTKTIRPFHLLTNALSSTFSRGNHSSQVGISDLLYVQGCIHRHTRTYTQNHTSLFRHIFLAAVLKCKNMYILIILVTVRLLSKEALPMCTFCHNGPFLCNHSLCNTLRTNS